MRHFVRARFQRRLFAWFAVSILLSGLAAGALVWVLGARDHPTWHDQVQRVQTFVGNRFADAWARDGGREALAAEIAENFDVIIVLRDPEGREVARAGDGVCPEAEFHSEIRHGPGEAGPVLGSLDVCRDHPHVSPGWLLLLALMSVVLVLWALAGGIARLLSRPLEQLVRVTRELGDGRLSSRVALNYHAPGEVGLLAESVNQMAARIEKQLADQRELLAAVSHELRTPLGHMRVLLELARELDTHNTQGKLLDDLEQEVLEVDGLVDQLLASSRLDFDSLDRRPLEGDALVLRALERAGLPAALLSVAGDDAPDVRVEGDATLLSRALANLLQNATEHGGGVTRVELRVAPADGDDGDAAREQIVFTVEDEGPGFREDERARVFSSFYRGERRAGAQTGSIGLGLSLVRRIAEAHGGRAWAENKASGGARVSFAIARGPSS